MTERFFFPLDTTTVLTDDGRLLPAKPLGELFARFTPQPKEMDEDIASRVVALVSQFDAPTLTAFRLSPCFPARFARRTSTAALTAL